MLCYYKKERSYVAICIAHTCNPSSEEAEGGGFCKSEASLGCSPDYIVCSVQLRIQNHSNKSKEKLICIAFNYNVSSLKSPLNHNVILFCVVYFFSRDYLVHFLTHQRWPSLVFLSSNFLGGDALGQFAVENIQNEWKVYVKKPLDREQKDSYLLTITATDGTFSSKARVEVKVLDANDNSPVCEKVGVHCTSGLYITSVSLFRTFRRAAMGPCSSHMFCVMVAYC